MSLPKYINRDSVPGEIFKNVLKDGSTPQSTTPPSGNNRSAASAHVAGSLNAGQLYVSTKQAKVQWQRPHIRSHTGHSYSRYHALFWRCGAVRSARLTLSRSLVCRGHRPPRLSVTRLNRPRCSSRRRPLCSALRTQAGHRATSEKCQRTNPLSREVLAARSGVLRLPR